MAQGKRIRSLNEKIDREKMYPLGEALGLVKELSNAKFDETVDAAVNLGINARKSDQNVRGATVLPRGTGKTVRVAVFADGENADAAREAEARVEGPPRLGDAGVGRGQPPLRLLPCPGR